MTEKELIAKLSQLQDLKKEVNELSQRISTLELKAQGKGWGHVSLARVKQAEQAAEELRERMENRRLDCMIELGRLYAFIDSVEDSRLRRILSARYIDGLIWPKVAFAIGETDEQVPRRLHNRLIHSLTQPD